MQRHFRNPHDPNSNSEEIHEASGVSRAEIYLDDETLQRMIETFGPLEYSQFTSALHPQEYGQLSDPFHQGTWLHEEVKRKSRSPRTEVSSTPEHYMLSQEQMQTETSTPGAAQVRRESLMEWFDRSVEKELRKRRDSVSPSAGVDPALAPLKTKHAINLTKGTAERLAEMSASRIEIASRLETDFTSELTDAVEKLAKAENMSNYTEALQAAEQAAQNAPPELVEQAAVAEARRIQAELSQVKETLNIDGVRPIEVVGYVGVTKPVHPKKC